MSIRLVQLQNGNLKVDIPKGFNVGHSSSSCENKANKKLPSLLRRSGKTKIYGNRQKTGGIIQKRDGKTVAYLIKKKIDSIIFKVSGENRYLIYDVADLRNTMPAATFDINGYRMEINNSTSKQEIVFVKLDEKEAEEYLDEINESYERKQREIADFSGNVPKHEVAIDSKISNGRLNMNEAKQANNSRPDSASNTLTNDVTNTDKRNGDGTLVHEILDATIENDDSEDEPEETVDFNDFKPVRKIYDWGKPFENSFNKKQLEEKVGSKLYKFFTMRGQYANGKWGDRYFGKHDFGLTKNVNGKKIEIRRCRVCGGHEYKERLFYCFGDQLDDRRFEAKDIILLYISKPDEHDKYDEIAQFLSEAIADKQDFGSIRIRNRFVAKGKSGLICYNSYGYNEFERRFVKSPVLTERQQTLIDDCLGKPPVIIYGAAGTGKTLMSEKLYKAISDSSEYGNNILYLTFIDSLAIYVREQLKNLGVDQKKVLCLTYDNFIERCFDAAFAWTRDGKYQFVQQIGNKKIKRLKSFDYFLKWVTGGKEIERTKIKGIDDIEYLSRNRFKLTDIDKNERDAASIVHLFFRSLNDSPNYGAFGESHRQAFEDKLKKEKDLDKKKINVIFEFCKAYAGHLKEKGFVDDNMAALLLKELFERQDCPINKFDAIIVDEMQDLTLPQIHSLTRIVKGCNFFAYGDDNQSINPSLLNMREAKHEIYKDFCLFNKDNIREPEYLTETIRSSSEVVSYINLLNHIRDKTIGKSKGYSQPDLVSLAPDSDGIKNSAKPAYLLDLNAFKWMVEGKELFLQNEIGVIVPSSLEREKFLKTFKFQNEQDLFTIDEIKGREKEIVVLYNFFSSSKDVWQKISEKYLEYHETGKGDDKFYSTLYRRFFNRYYVGLTRAKKKVIICEDSSVPEEILNCFLRNPEGPLENIRSAKHLNRYFSNDFTHDRWYTNAVDFFNLKQYNDAYNYISNAVESLEKLKGENGFDEDTLKEYAKLKDEYLFYKIFTELTDSENNGVIKDSEREKAQKCIDFFLSEGEIDNARELYKRCDAKKEELAHYIKHRKEKGDNNVIMKYRSVMNSFSEAEEEYFGNEIIDCYKNKIINQIGELTYGRKNHR